MSRQFLPRRKHSCYREPRVHQPMIDRSHARGGVQAEQASVNVMPTFERR
jgi:hypothetical protein